MKHIVLFAFVALAALAALARASIEKRIDINWGDAGMLLDADRVSQWTITRYSSGVVGSVDYGHNSVLAVPIDANGDMIAGSQSILIDLVTYDHEGSVINDLLSYINANAFSAANFPVNAKSDVSVALKTYAVPNNRVPLDSFTIDNANPSTVLNTMHSSVSETFTEGKVYFRFDPSGNCQGLAKTVMTGLRGAFGA